MKYAERQYPQLVKTILVCLIGYLPILTRVDAADNDPAENQFVSWLNAVNSGNRDSLRQFISENFEPPPSGDLPVDKIANHQFELFKSSGGYAARKISQGPPGTITGVIEAKRTGFGTTVTMFVKPSPPYRILGMGLSGSELPAESLPQEQLSDAQLRTKLDDMIARLEEADQFSGVILVARNGTPVYQKASGLASRAWGIGNKLDTKFNIASIGKMFTAVAVAQLVEQGKLSYDDLLDKALPEYANKEIARKVTVAHLLSHTSGIKEQTVADDPFRRGYRKIKDYLTGTEGDTLKFEPGTKLSYSNHGYLLLGAIIEKASGQDFDSYLRDQIFKPAGMNNTGNFDLDLEPPNLATGYMDAENGTRRSNAFRLPVKGLPAGLGYSTAEDLVKFQTALVDKKLVSSKTLERLWSGNLDYSEKGSKYGYGCIVKEYNGTRIVGHGGGWLGITNKFDMYPDLGFTVAILNNIDSDPNAIAFKLREWLTQGRNGNLSK